MRFPLPVSVIGGNQARSSADQNPAARETAAPAISRASSAPAPKISHRANVHTMIATTPKRARESNLPFICSRYRQTHNRVNGGTLAKEIGFVMSSLSGKHSEHRMSKKTEAARVVAKLLAKRHTSINEIPDIIENVERALKSLDSNAGGSIKKQPEAVAVKSAPAPRAKRAVSARKPAEAHDVAPVGETPTIENPSIEKPVIDKAAAETQEIKPAQPTLLRRAEVIHVAPVAPPAPPPTPTNGMVRGVVQWFDTRSTRGTLRLQGLSNDVPIDGDILTAAGLTRLFKGQEIEATLEGNDETPKITGLRLLNLSPASPVMGGMVRDRHAKQVVVELKREALSRAAARAEAEALMPTRRAR
jgi:cold shock CspA family protein